MLFRFLQIWIGKQKGAEGLQHDNKQIKQAIQNQNSPKITYLNDRPSTMIQSN